MKLSFQRDPAAVRLPSDVPPMNPFHRHPSARATAPDRGVALVITLMMLSLITVLAITILAIARRERGQLAQVDNYSDAEFAAAAGFERAKADMLGQIMYHQNLSGYDLISSKSVSNALASLQMDPRVPVFVTYSSNGVTVTEERHYIDFNRNRQYEESLYGGGLWQPGDPQWIGILRDPNQPHGPDNPFVARYAYLALPAGKTLDLNAIGNIGPINPNMNANRDAFLRNQGFGPWELNLAAFLADLNPNVWGGQNYQYRPGLVSSGFAFDDARDLLKFRYQWVRGALGNNPASVQDLFGILGEAAFATDLVDGYVYGPYATTGYALPGVDSDRPTDPWPGAPNRANFFSHQDLFNPRITGTNFTLRLRAAGAQTDDFNRYTFYRLLTQLGTDTTPPREDRLHLNYANVGSLFGTSLSETNFQPWWVDPTTNPLLSPALVDWTNKVLSVRFFTNLAQRLYADQIQEFSPDPTTGLIISNITMIPVWPTNLYSPGIHRILQEAANIYDATRAERLPTVFRPIIRGIGALNYIVGYTNDNSVATLGAYLMTDNTNGIPLVIGAKKGLPNFNEYTLRTEVLLSRKLEVVYQGRNATHQFATNQMYILGISNMFGFELWNSYTNAYPYPLIISVTNHTTVILSNQYGFNLFTNFNVVVVPTVIAANSWLGTGSPINNYLVPTSNTVVLLTNSVWIARNNTMIPAAQGSYQNDVFERNLPVPFLLPEWQLIFSNNFTYVLSEGDRMVDFVRLTELQSATDLMRDMMGPTEVEQSASQVAGSWDTNRVDGSYNETVPTQGVVNQIAISLTGDEIDPTVWANWNNGRTRPSKDSSSQKFRDFLTLQGTNAVGSNMQAPFSAIRRMARTSTWQANDPLVHYLQSDLTLYPTNSDFIFVMPPQGGQASNSALASLGHLNSTFWPWGGNPERSATANDPMSFDRSIKDPGVRKSDDWDFPAGKFASVGWLGRVHRGTPWQTVYFKPETPDLGRWSWQSRDPFFRTVPTNDWRLVDVTTVATYPPAGRVMPVNQTNLAAWSALLAGTMVVTNYLDDDTLVSLLRGRAGSNYTPGLYVTNLVIQPASSYLAQTPLANPVVQIYQAIQNVRNLLPTRQFTRLSQLFLVPDLTTASPFLHSSDIQVQFGLNDLAYEMLPTRLMSLLRLDEPRFVIYAYGQSLKPAPQSIDPATRVISNYQVTGEFGTRTVLRVDGSWASPTAVIEGYNILPPD